MRIAPAQLEIWTRPAFKPMPRKGRLAAEFRLSCAVADMIARFVMPGWRWSHLPFGELRTFETANRLKRMGTHKGWPDYLFVHERGACVWMELKRRGGRLSDEQIEIAKFLKRAGHCWLIADTFVKARDQLILWGVLKPEAKDDGTNAQRQWAEQIRAAG